jgi:hypothetical protein
VLWTQHRTTESRTQEAHSLYLEVLAELGVVGLVLVLVALLTILGAMAFRARGRNRAAGAALLAMGVTWAVHAGLDWDWEIPAVTLWLFAAGGLLLAARQTGERGPRIRRPFVRAGLAVGCLTLAATPVLVSASQTNLSESVSAYQRGDCRTAVDAALDSISALDNRPQPFEVLGYCNARAGNGPLAERMMREAIERDPENWELHYGLALVRASAGRDPRPALRRARTLNPREPLLRDAANRMRSRSRSRWRRSASELGLVIRW